MVMKYEGLIRRCPQFSFHQDEYYVSLIIEVPRIFEESLWSVHVHLKFISGLVERILLLGLLCNSSDGRVVRTSASGFVDLGLIASRVKPMTVKLVFTPSLLDVQH